MSRKSESTSLKPSPSFKPPAVSWRLAVRIAPPGIDIPTGDPQIASQAPLRVEEQLAIVRVGDVLTWGDQHAEHPCCDAPSADNYSTGPWPWLRAERIDSFFVSAISTAESMATLYAIAAKMAAIARTPKNAASLSKA